MLKRILPLVVVLLAAGCSLFIARKPREVLGSVNGFTMEEFARVTAIRDVETVHYGNRDFCVEFGADSVYTARYGRGGERYVAELISFRDAEGAFGAYESAGMPGGTVLAGSVRARLSATMAQGVKGRYVLTVAAVTNGRQDGLETLLVSLIGHVKGLNLEPELYRRLPAEGRVEDSTFYFRGPRTFSNRYSPSLAGTLQLDRMKRGTSALYETGGTVASLFIIDYEDYVAAVEARDAFLRSRADRPVIEPSNTEPYYVVVEADRTENYIAAADNRLFLMLGSPRNSTGRERFEYVVRGGTD